MKNKTTVYLLIAVVLFVWGMVFYRIFSGMNSDGHQAYIKTRKAIITVKSKKKEEMVVLMANYRDPFLGSTPKATEYRRAFDADNSAARPVKQSGRTDWSFLDYIGIVNNTTTHKKVGLLSIHGKEYMVNEKDRFEGVTIVKKERDSILVIYNKERKWIRR